jgi:hypothetical protein
VARNLTAGFIAEATAATNRPIVLFRGVFASSTILLWNGWGDISWAAQTWLGNGWFQSMEGGDETTEVEATDMTIVLSGVPSSVISLVLSDQKQGAEGAIWIGFLNSSGAVINDPYLWWKGVYSHAELDYSPDAPLVRLMYDSPLMDMERPREQRWTHDCQTKLFSGDLGFQYVQAAANWHGTWSGQKKKLSKEERRGTRKPKGSPKKNK